MNRTTLTRVAMTTAGIMLAHQVPSKAFRDAAFLTAWPTTALPGLTLATAALVLALVPLFSRLLDRFSPLAAVTIGFAISAAGHAIEWSVYDGGRAGLLRAHRRRRHAGRRHRQLWRGAHRDHCAP